MNNAFSFKPYFVLAFAGVAAGLTAEDLVPDADGVISIGSKNNTTITQAFADLPNQAVSLKKVGTGWTHLKPEGESTFSGGIVIADGQLRVSGPQAIGTGPIKIGSSGCSLILDGENTVVSGRVTFNRSESNSGWAASLNNLLTFTDINGYAKLGRDKGNASKVAIVPTATSAALTNVVLNGKIDLALGGTIKIGEGVGAALFDASLPQTTPTVHVMPTGVTFEMAEGVEATLGVPLASDPAERLVARLSPTDFDFENGGWTLEGNGGATDTSGSAITDNESGYVKVDNAVVPAYCTTNGTHFLALRRTCTASKTFTLEKAGDWRLVFDGSCRPANDYSLNLKVVARVDGVTVAETDVVTENAQLYPWRRFSSEPLKLTAGEHTVSFACTDNNFRNSGYFIDTVRLEQIDTHGKITVSGAGTLAFDPTAVPANARLTVAKDATLALTGEAQNLIVNGGFEDSGAEAFTTGAANWTFTNSDSNRASGHQKDGCTMTKDGPSAPEGSYTAYLRDTSTMAQTVTASEAGKYRLSFEQACRMTYNSWLLTNTVTIDGEQVLTIPAQMAAYGFVEQTVEVELTAGKHEIMFTTGEGDSGSITGNMIFLDDIRLTRVPGETDLTGTAFAFVKGSVLKLGDGVSIKTDSVTVDGKAFKGSVSGLRAAGVIVEGRGRFKTTAQPGLAVLIK